MRRIGDLDEGVQEWLDRVQYCIDHCVDSNDWEDDFLENVKDWLGMDRMPSMAQMDTIKKIEFLTENGREEYWEEYGRG